MAPEAAARGPTRTSSCSSESAASSLERDLEHIMEGVEVEEQGKRGTHGGGGVEGGDAKRTRQGEVSGRRQTSASPPPPSEAAPVTAAPATGSAGGAGFLSDEAPQQVVQQPVYAATQEQLRQLEAAQHAARAKQNEAATRKRLCVEELHQAEQVLQEALVSLARLECEVPHAELLARASEEKLRWLDHLLQHCESAKARQVFEGEVMEAFGGAVSRLRSAEELQQARVREAVSGMQSLRERCQAGSREQGERERKVARIKEKTSRVDEEMQAIQLNIDHLGHQISQTRNLLEIREQVSKAAGLAEDTEAACQKAAKERDAVRTQYTDSGAWVEELRSFFEGRGARGINAICRGLQALLPSGDPLPVIVRAMLTEASAGKLDPANPTLLSVRELVSEQVQVARARLQERLAEQQRVCTKAEQGLTEARQQLQGLKEQLRGALAQARHLEGCAPSEHEFAPRRCGSSSVGSTCAKA